MGGESGWRRKGENPLSGSPFYIHNAFSGRNLMKERGKTEGKKGGLGKSSHHLC